MSSLNCHVYMGLHCTQIYMVLFTNLCGKIRIWKQLKWKVPNPARKRAVEAKIPETYSLKERKSVNGEALNRSPIHRITNSEMKQLVFYHLNFRSYWEAVGLVDGRGKGAWNNKITFLKLQSNFKILSIYKMSSLFLVFKKNSNILFSHQNIFNCIY